MEDPEVPEVLSTQYDDLITMTMVMHNCYSMMMMNDPEDLDAADILIQLSGSDTHSGGLCTTDSPGAGSESSSYSMSSRNEGDPDDNYKLVKLSKDDGESSCANSTAVAYAGRKRPSLSLSSSSSLSFRSAELQKRNLAAAAADDGGGDVDEEDEDGFFIDMGCCGEIEGYPLRRKRKFRSIVDVYAQSTTMPFHQQVVTKKSNFRPARRSTN